MTILVTGSRYWQDYDTIKSAIRSYKPKLVIEGGATGADALARVAAITLKIPYKTYEAKWKDHGKAAGGIRNQKMLDSEPIDLVLAFPLPGSIGTYDCIRRAQRAKVKVRIYEAAIKKKGV